MRSPFLSFKWTSVISLALLVYFVIVPSIDAQGTTECNRQTFSPVDCPPSSSGEEKSNNDNEDDSGNIEKQIPSVIPFP